MLEVGHLGVDWYQVVVGWQLVVVRVLVGFLVALISNSDLLESCIVCSNRGRLCRCMVR